MLCAAIEVPILFCIDAFADANGLRACLCASLLYLTSGQHAASDFAVRYTLPEEWNHAVILPLRLAGFLRTVIFHFL
jgi:hypothetical protein